MINRFTKPVQHSIKDTQVLPRTELLLGRLQQRQAKYDEQVTKLQQTQGTVSGYKVVGDVASMHLKNVEDMLSEASSNLLTKDLSDPKVVSDVNKLIGSIAGDEKLKVHLAAADNYQKYSDQLAELTKKGKLSPANYFKYEEAWKHYKKTGEYSDQLSNPLIEEAIEVLPARHELFKHINASGSEGVAFLKSLTGDKDETLAYKTGHKGVNGQKIAEAVEGQLLAYVNSAAGRQEKRDYDYMVHRGAIDPNKTPFQKFLINELLGTGQVHTYSQTTSDIASAYKERGKQAKEEASAGEGYLPAMGLGKKIELDSDGRINVPAYKDLWGMITGDDPRTPEQLELEKTLTAMGNKAGMSMQEVVAAVNKDPNIKLSYYNTKKSAEVSKRLYDPKTGGGQFFTRTVKNDQYPGGISMAEYFKEEGMSEQEAKGGFTVVGEVKPDNPLTPKGMVLLINGKPVIIDDSHNLDIRNNKEDQKALYEFEAAQARYNGKGSHTAVLGDENGMVRFKWEWNPKTNEVVQTEAKVVKNN